MQDPSQEAVYNLESLIPGQLYTAPVSIEAAITEWLKNIESLHSTNSSLLSDSMTLRVPDCPKIGFELPDNKEAKTRPIMCLFSTPESGTWTGCLFTTPDEAPCWGKMATIVGLNRCVYKSLFAQTRSSGDIGFAGSEVKITHFPVMLGSGHLGFNGQEGDKVSYMLCLPVRLPFPSNGKLNLLLPRVVGKNKNSLERETLYPCPSFIVSAASYKDILVQALKTEAHLGAIIRCKLKGGERAQYRKIEGEEETPEVIQVKGNMEVGGTRELVEVGEETKRNSYKRNKRKRDEMQKDQGKKEAQKKMKGKGGNPGPYIPPGTA